MLLIALIFATFPAKAVTYVLPKGDVVGRITYANIKGDESLKDVARKYGLGINEVIAANPHVDPEKPGDGKKVIIPLRYVLPKVSRKGIVINIAEKRLYYYSKPSEGPPLVSIYPVSIGPDVLKAGAGSYKVTQRLRKPTWTVSTGDKARLKAAGQRVSKRVLPGHGNPLGEYALTLNSGGLMIHGTNDASSIGTDVNLAYVRMYPEDVNTLIHLVPTGTPVRFINQPVKYGHKNGALYLELHKPPHITGELNLAALVNWMSQVTSYRMWEDDCRRVRQIAEQASGVAMPVIQEKPRRAEGRAWWLKVVSYKEIDSARQLENKVAALGVPMMINGCYDGQPCTLMVGPFTDRSYIQEVRKKIKWMTRLKGYTVPYKAEDDFKPIAILADAG